MRRSDTLWIMEEIHRAIIQGISVRVDGICSIETKGSVSGVQEEVTYMEDYIGDADGRIVEISFSRVRLPESQAMTR